MGQKVHPTGMRLGIIKKHNANWYAKGKDYPKFLNEDLKVREFIGTKLKFSSISKVELDRSAQAYVVNIHSSRPGIIIGKKGEEIENLKKQIKKIVNLPTQVNIKSASIAASAGVSALLPEYSETHFSAFEEVLLKTVTSCPALEINPAIGYPMTPKPINATLLII